MVVRRDARREALAHAGGRVRARPWRHRAGHVEADGGTRVGAEVPGRDHGRRRPTREARHGAEGVGGPDRCRLPRPLLHELRRGGRPARSGDHHGTAQSGEGRSRQRAGERAREGGAHPALQGVVSSRARGRHGEPRAQCAPGCDQLGAVPGSAAPDELAVPPLRRHDPNQGGNQT